MHCADRGPASAADLPGVRLSGSGGGGFTGIICGGIILSVIVLVNLWNVLPFAATACFAFLSLRVDEAAIMDYIFNAAKFFLTSQQLYFWREN